MNGVGKNDAVVWKKAVALGKRLDIESFTGKELSVGPATEQGRATMERVARRANDNVRKIEAYLIGLGGKPSILTSYALELMVRQQVMIIDTISKKFQEYDLVNGIRFVCAECGSLFADQCLTLERDGSITSVDEYGDRYEIPKSALICNACSDSYRLVVGKGVSGECLSSSPYLDKDSSVSRETMESGNENNELPF